MSLVVSALVSYELVSNAHSRSSLRPKRIFWNEILIQNVFPPINRIPTFSSSSYLLLQYYPSKRRIVSSRKTCVLSKNVHLTSFLRVFLLRLRRKLHQRRLILQRKELMGRKRLVSNIFSGENQDLNPS